MGNFPDGSSTGIDLTKQGFKSSLARTGVVYLIGCLTAPILVVIVFGGVFLLNTYLKQAPIRSGPFLAIVFVLLFLVIFGVLYLVMAIVILRRKRFLDSIFVPIGFESRMHNLMFRRYQGIVVGRRVEVFFTKGPVVEILIETSLRTRLGVSLDYPDTVTFSDLLGSQPLRPNSPELQGLLFWANEERWAGNLVSIPQAGMLINRLLRGESRFLRRFLKLQPTVLQLHYSGNANIFKIDLGEALVRQWLSDAFELLSLAETSVLPAQPIEMSPAETTALRWKRKNLTWFLVSIYVGLPLFVALVVGVLTIFIK